MSAKNAAALGAAVFVLGLATDVAAQATFTPTYHAPYRSFESHEFGAVLSFPDGNDFGLEGLYSFGYERFDVGLRGGFIDNGGTTFVFGVEGRARVIDHTSSDFPLDGAVIVGVGTAEFDAWIVPVGISLGRRVELEGFEFVVYGQPTLFLTRVDTPFGGDTDLDFNLGLGIDFTIADALDLRTSFAFLDAPGDGIAFSLVWVR